jgi:NifU-like protein involved in Fe-S cluster formation
MDAAIIKYFRNLSRNGFKYAGSFDDASIVLKDDSGGCVRVCSSVGMTVHLYLKINSGKIEKIRYRCICSPITHVAVEILCELLEGKSLNEITSINISSFYNVLGAESEDLKPKAENLLELVKSGLKNQ